MVPGGFVRHEVDGDPARRTREQSPPVGAMIASVMRLLLVAPLRGEAGRVPDVFETLGPLLEGEGHGVTMTSTKPGRLARAVDMVRTARRERGEVDAVIVHVYSGRAFVVEDGVTRAAAGPPLVGVLAGGDLPAFADRHPRRVQRVLARFDRLVAPSEYLARWARTQTSVAVTVIPNPLDVDAYDHRSREDPRPRLLWLRAYHPIYGPAVAVRAAALLAEHHPDLRLTMVGADKGDRARIQELAEALGVEDQVRVGGFAGPQQKAALFADHDIFVNTSRVDNRPVSVVEAAACGLCIVSTDVGGIPDLVAAGRSALLVPPDDPEALARAVERLLTEEGLGARLSAGARVVAEEGRPDLVVAQWSSLLSDLTE